MPLLALLVGRSRMATVVAPLTFHYIQHVFVRGGLVFGPGRSLVQALPGGRYPTVRV